MKKYLLVFQQTFSQYVTYRLQIILKVVQSFLPPMIIVTALSMTSATGTIAVNQLLPYYILIALIYPLTISTIDEEIGDLSATGDVNNFLLKPFSLFKWLFAKNLSEKVVIFITLLPVLLIIGFKYDFNLLKILFISVSLCLSFILSFTLSYLAGLFCFWVDEFWAIQNLKYVIIQLLGGVVLPYSFFPKMTSDILQLTPFPYLASWSVRIIQNQATLVDIPIVLFWIVILFLLTLIIQKKAISKYSFTAG
jgi:ABC-2 type transport system permease protein